jgi:flagellin
MVAVNSDIGVMCIQRNLNKRDNGLETALQRFSSGIRIDNAGDAVTGLAIFNRMTAQIYGLNRS